jgi:hypothetical protein
VQSHYDERFTREMGCTEAEWLRWLPAAIGECAWQRDGQRALVDVPPGRLVLRWQALPPRAIALVRMPVLQVDFEFEALSDEKRFAFMRRFDLYMQRGGG